MFFRLKNLEDEHKRSKKSATNHDDERKDMVQNEGNDVPNKSANLEVCVKVGRQAIDDETSETNEKFRRIVIKKIPTGKAHDKKQLNCSNIIIFLDDVDDCKQLHALVGSHKWFGSGSRIIITTRDEHVLLNHKVDCPVTLLSCEETAMLFNKYAYNKDGLLNDYEKLSLRMLSYSNGLPLALKVLGSFLYDKDEKEWESCLSRLKDIPEKEIIDKLKISYDGLKTVEKELFLDIASFFRGKNDDSAIEVLEACGYHLDIGIKVLLQKALITIVNDKFDMRDLIQEMGHYIVRGEHPSNPEKHSRV
ncbi:disease resistance protein RUN1-like [Bidens hawaiensis]|uniref:disease resistance protein RUN1-like n=1 Tax=Bidens hawaiensis TaxID=980011 RepID=UPI00404B8157